SAPGGVIVALTDQDARVTGPDGSTRELHYKAGQARWAAATPGADQSSFSAHAEENLSDRPFELIRIDPKVAAPAHASAGSLMLAAPDDLKWESTARPDTKRANLWGDSTKGAFAYFSRYDAG